ncbi:nucleotidyltransferase domain-containing protein [Desertibaculum subflavum]|uniref:nucleotidyltransferase domain-containing protein n=1 Tax=Desertibaculum subflavum TaxID=2268458 RepID=UPI000E66BEF1
MADPAGAGLLRALREPAAMAGFEPALWNLVLPRARNAGLVGRLGVRAEAAGIAAALPERVRDMLVAAEAVAATHDRMIRFEVGRIRRALDGTGIGFTLLKGAAYVLGGLKAARGRLVSDVDILVARERIDEVERRLIEHGWRQEKTSAYDQRYYRDWMHELPPLRHRGRMTVVDVHHNILPLTGRLRIDAAKLLAAARPVEGLDGVTILAPADLVLHNVVHLFQDGDVNHGLRDLADLDDLLRHFGPEPGFWSALAARTAELGLGRPVNYALRHAAALLGTPIDPALRAAVGRTAAPPPIDRLMQALLGRALARSGQPAPDLPTRLAREALYLRSHWLRMPPVMLAGHLARKGAMQFLPERQGV